ncbi:MAG: response regulator transcription factor [Sandaracinaceae bacterium]|nr:response regulator transcription factor [Sandaracinaceae bacterium]
MRILLVEDEERLARFLVRGLREEGHQLDHCTHGKDARARIEALGYDVIVLDWMLPDDDGIAILEHLRREGIRTPVLMLTARGETREKVLGLRTGADDYLTKPFEFEELLARLQALHRRSEGAAIEHVLGDVVLDAKKRALRHGRTEVSLTAREHALLSELFAHAGEVRTRAQLLGDVWGHAFEGDPNILDVYMGYVRAKLAKITEADATARVPSIKAVRGVGFRLSLEDEGR